MKYEEVKVEGYLSNFVKCFWTSETSTKSVEHTILPDGYFDLIVEIKGEKVKKIKLTGIWTIPIAITTSNNTKIFAVRFKPLATELLENVDLKSLLNSSRTFQTTFLGLDTLSLDNFKAFCQHVEIHLKNRIEQSKQISELKICLFNQIFKKKTFSVQELSQKSFWTSRQINRYFNLTYGLSLKTYLNIIRCNATYKDISKNKLAPQGNYFDQAHFIKEIKKITGVTPRELYRNENDRFLQLSTLKEN
jgi:AraC-like DNA-binding protein